MIVRYLTRYTVLDSHKWFRHRRLSLSREKNCHGGTVSYSSLGTHLFRLTLFFFFCCCFCFFLFVYLMPLSFFYGSLQVGPRELKKKGKHLRASVILSKKKKKNNSLLLWLTTHHFFFLSRYTRKPVISFYHIFFFLWRTEGSV